jgi:PIN domain nuclease of toxin-antitoxin system
VRSGAAITPMITKHVVDTHALVWHLEGNPRLGSSAKTVLGDPSSELVLPMIALAEACWMVEHGKTTISNVQDLLAAVDADPRLEITPLNREILDRSLGLAVIDEMHDRQIVASALVLQDKGATVAILTRDSVIQSSGLATVIW